MRGGFDPRLPIAHPAWRQLWRRPGEWVVWDGRAWVAPGCGWAYRGEDWVGIRQDPDSPGWPFMAVDWDNPDGRRDGAVLFAAQARLRAVCRQRGWPCLQWRSKSGTRRPRSGSAHLFIGLPGRSLPEQAELVRQALTEALGFPPCPGDSRLDRHGLQPAGQFLFPAPDIAHPIYLGVCRWDSLRPFLDVWGQLFRSGE